MARITKKNLITILDILEEAYPDAKCALNYRSVFELLVAVMLSAQTTDISVNVVTPDLFSRYPDAKAIAEASIEEIQNIIHKIGMYKTKSKNLIALCTMLCDKYDGRVPQDYDKLTELPGVGRKTANVVLSVGFGEQRIAVDTHVFRVANRIGIVSEKNVLDTELSLMKAVPESRWTKTHHCLIFHGRQCCHARKPNCGGCPIADLCKKVL